MKSILSILFFLSISCEGQIFPLVFRTPASSSCDSDAQAFITAAGITDDTEESAICTLVADLKSNSLWTKFYAIYPYVGSTSTSCKYNLIDPQDTDGAFRLTFNGGFTYASTGLTPNGSTGYAQTHLVPSTVMVEYDTHFSVWVRTDPGAGTKREMGYYNGGASLLEMSTRLAGDALYSRTYGVAGAVAAAANSSAIGYWISSCTSSGSIVVYKDGSSFASGSPVSGLADLTGEFYIGALNTGGTAGSFSDREQIIATFGTGLTSGESATLYTILNTFKTTLGR